MIWAWGKNLTNIAGDDWKACERREGVKKAMRHK
jgi:hypothetical protein